MKYLAPFCAALLALPAVAGAADRPSGPYIGAGAGVNFARDIELDATGANLDLEHEKGYVGVLSFGHAFENGFRFELEGGKRRNEIDKSGGVTVNGRTSVLSGMLNAYYDFATGSAFIPYLGAGVGFGTVDISAAPTGNTSVDDSGSGLGLQGIAGIGYQLTDNLAGTLEYRYFTIQGAGVKTTAGAGSNADYASHSLLVGLRYTFGEPKKKMVEPEPKPMPVAEKKPEPAPPPPPPPPPPPITRNFIVFFDWDRAEITPEARAILQSAADNAKKGNISRIQATGHADRSGTQAYNLRLSERRAKAVQAALAQFGIAAGDVATDWKGELEPLVPTDDGVREPQNRRVEIVFP